LAENDNTKQLFIMNLEDQLLQFVKEWDEAMVSNNIDEIARFMSDDWVIVGTEGGITSKPEFLEWIKSGDVTHHRMDADEIRIKIYGDTGVITSRGTSAGHYKGQPFDLYEWSSNVFIYKEEKWSCVLTMLTPANKK
jgi:ketosteroid isomerase-like protein